MNFASGIIQSTNSAGFINNGTLIMGVNDDEVIVEDIVKILGKNIGLENNAIFNFYDGYIEAKVGLKGSYNEIPEDYIVYVEHLISNGYQKVYLVAFDTNAVAKTLDIYNKPVYYNNLQDAFNTAMESETLLPLYAIRNFEAAYELFVNADEEIRFDLSGWTVNTGSLITNNGTLTITDSKRRTILEGIETEVIGILKPSKTIVNNGTLNITNVSIEETTSANVITNTGIVNLNNANIKAAAGYGIYNEEEGNITGSVQSTITSNSYAIYNSGIDCIFDANINIFFFVALFLYSIKLFSVNTKNLTISFIIAEIIVE